MYPLHIENYRDLEKYLIVIVGPTAVGKTGIAIDIARQLDAEILSADSRQFYKGLNIGTAAPTSEELLQIPHHFVGHLNITDTYNVSRYEQDVLSFLKNYYKIKDVAVLVGGSGLYINAVCQGIDELPDPDVELRDSLKKRLATEGLEDLCSELNQLDPEYFNIVDKNNPNRILRALEVCLTTGKTYTSLRNLKPKKRNFNIIKIGLKMPREQLINRIHQRVDKMISSGLVEEVRGLLPHRNLNALNTVGYKEIFNYIDGKWSLNLAVEKIKTNTRRYAKRQMTWFSKDKENVWFDPENYDSILGHIRNSISKNQSTS